MKTIAIAVNTFREAVRDKILYSLVFFALLMISCSILLGKLTVGEYFKIIKDVGLGSISLFGVLIAIFVGIGLIHKELERKTIYTIVSKPIYRAQFILGKFLGLALTLAVQLSVMSLGFIILTYMQGSTITMEVMMSLVFIYMELLLVTAFSMMFGAFSTPTLSGLFSLSVYVIGHLTPDLRMFGSQSDSEMVQKLSEVLYFILPNLENFNYKNQAVHDVAIPTAQYLYSFGYGAIYTALVLMAAMVIFQKRDFK